MARRGLSSIAQKAKNPGKKYDRAILVCTIKGCSEEFAVSKCTTPAKRRCSKHLPFNASAADTKDVVLLKSLGFV